MPTTPVGGDLKRECRERPWSHSRHPLRYRVLGRVGYPIKPSTLAATRLTTRAGDKHHPDEFRRSRAPLNIVINWRCLGMESMF